MSRCEAALMDKKRKQFLEIEPTPGEDAVKTAVMTTKDLEYKQSLRGFDFNSGRSSTVGNMLSNSIICYREISPERKSQLIWQTSLLYYFKNLPKPSLLSAANTLNPDQSATIIIEATPSPNIKGYDSLKSQIIVSIF